LERPLPIQVVGTGGIASALFIREAFGYQPYEVLEQPQVNEVAPYVKLMEQVKAGFGRTMSRLPEVFGVSRQTLYNWLEGDTPKVAHQERLRQLAEAAKVFADLGIRPTTPMLDRTVAQGKSFLQLMAAGADGQETAKKLIRIVQRSNDSRSKLDTLLAERRAKLSASDIGAPALDEDV
jgi:transcriptional regulator with XRE-family HTH domain